jgi:hypothetical protein
MIASGTTTATIPNFPQTERRKKCPATILVMMSERVDRIPLHPSSTLIVMFDNTNTKPSRITGTPSSENPMSVTSVELHCRNTIIV